MRFVFSSFQVKIKEQYDVFQSMIRVNPDAESSFFIQNVREKYYIIMQCFFLMYTIIYAVNMEFFTSVS